MARRATSLGPKRSLFVLVVFWFVFCFLKQKKLVFLPEKGISCLFSVFLFLFPLAFFGIPLFLFLFLCLSVFFFVFFLFVFPFCVLLVPCFCLFCFFFFIAFFFHERNNIKILNCKFCLHQYFSFFGFLSFSVSSSFFLSLLFLILGYVFCSTSRFLISKQTT